MKDIWNFFAFPLNLFLASIWMVGWWGLWKRYPNNKGVKFLLSPFATISSIIILLVLCIWMGFSGDRSFSQSIIFVTALLYVQTVVFIITLRGWKKADGKIRWRFLFIHAGFLLIIGSGFWGSPDSYEVRLYLEKGQKTRETYMIEGQKRILPYEIELKDYRIDVSPDGQPVHYEASVSIDGKPEVRICVNHPYRVKAGEDIYLNSVRDSGCVLQVVREPWRYFALTGIIMILIGVFMLFLKGPRK